VIPWVQKHAFYTSTKLLLLSNLTTECYSSCTCPTFIGSLSNVISLLMLKSKEQLVYLCALLWCKSSVPCPFLALIHTPKITTAATNIRNTTAADTEDDMMSTVFVGCWRGWEEWEGDMVLVGTMVVVESLPGCNRISAMHSSARTRYSDVTIFCNTKSCAIHNTIFLHQCSLEPHHIS